jgi:hypothetical protein
VGRSPLNHSAERDNRLNALLLRKLARDNRNLICAGNPDDRKVALVTTKSHKRVNSALYELFREKTVETADHKGNLHAFGTQISCDFLHIATPE